MKRPSTEDLLKLAHEIVIEVRKALPLARRHKNAVHGTLIIVIGVSLWHEGGGHADWSFLALAILTELLTGEPPSGEQG